MTETLRVGGTPVACYIVRPTLDPTLAPRPYLHPVRTLAGTVVTDMLPEDHRWHLGVSVAMPDVAGVNLWGGRSYVHGQGYIWRADHGRIEHTGWRSRAVDALDEDLLWLDPTGTPLLSEHRVLTATPVDGGWQLAVDLALTTVRDQPIELRSPAANGRGEGAGYGGFFWRLPPSTDARLAAGPLTEEAAINGSTEPALTVTGRTRDAPYALEFTGLTGEDRWFVRLAEYPGIGVALAYDHPLTIAPGQPLRRTYRVTIRD